MKLIQAAFLIGLCSILACQPSTPDATAETAPKTTTPAKSYPEVLQKIFTKHGGLDQWRKMKTLSYEIEKKEVNEKQTIQLHDRRERIEAENFITGFDGKDFWLEADTTTYKGNAVFYHNLMFYFYAMPFVVADDGIIYSEVSPLIHEGKVYPGIKISYESGVGVSPKDEYYVHYNPETFQMEWLGYTVTYYSDKKSDDLGWINYDDWETYNGLLLPKSMNWHKIQDGKLVPRRRRTFLNVEISAEDKEADFYQKTEQARIVK